MNSSHTAAATAYGAMFVAEVRMRMNQGASEDRAMSDPAVQKLALKAAKKASEGWIAAQKELFGVDLPTNKIISKK